MFKYNNIYEYRSVKNNTFIVCAMFTSNPKFDAHFNRLLNSCKKFDLSYAIFDVPYIHKSISSNGTNDTTYTKANFILNMFKKYPNKNILYVDIDIEINEFPELFNHISQNNYDIAIYNWFNDKNNEIYIPVNYKLNKKDIPLNFYVFFHKFEEYDPTQLVCSGAVQYYGNNQKSTDFLKKWHHFISKYPDYEDDQMLDLVYNNFYTNKLKTYWLEKNYCRYPFWPHIKPVINHVGFPAPSRNIQLNKIKNYFRYYPKKAQINDTDLIFPQNYIIDIKKRVLLKFENQKLVETKLLNCKFWPDHDLN